MKSLKIFMVVLASIFGASCSDLLKVEEKEDSTTEGLIELTAEEYASISNDNLYELSDDEIFDFIREFKKIGQESSTRAISESNIKIRGRETISSGKQNDIMTRTDSDNPISTTIASVEVSDEGRTDLAIVGTDSRAPKVIAYIGNGAEGICSEELLLLIAASKQEQLRDISHVEENKKYLREATINRICEEYNLDRAAYSFDDIKDRMLINSPSGKTRAMWTPGIIGMPPRVKAWIGPLSNLTWSPGQFCAWINEGRQFNYYSHSMRSDGSYQRITRNGSPPVSHSIMALAKAVAIAEPYCIGVGKDNKLLSSNIDWPRIKETPTIVYDWDGIEIMGWEWKEVHVLGFLNLLYRHSNSSLKTDNAGIVERMITPNTGLISIARQLISFQTLSYYDWYVAKASLDNIRPVILYGQMQRNNKLINGIHEVYDYAILMDGYAVCDAVGGTIGSTINYFHVNSGWGSYDSNAWFVVPSDMEVEMEWETEEGVYFLNSSRMSMMYQIYDNGFSYRDSRLWDQYGPQPPDPRDPGGEERWD